MANLETWSRREVVRIGGLSLAGTLAPRVARSVTAEESPRLKKRCIFLMLQGGPSHLDLWDPKRAERLEVRFKPLRLASPAWLLVNSFPVKLPLQTS